MQNNTIAIWCTRPAQEKVRSCFFTPVFHKLFTTQISRQPQNKPTLLLEQAKQEHTCLGVEKSSEAVVAQTRSPKSDYSTHKEVLQLQASNLIKLLIQPRIVIQTQDCGCIECVGQLAQTKIRFRGNEETFCSQPFCMQTGR